VLLLFSLRASILTSDLYTAYVSDSVPNLGPEHTARTPTQEVVKMLNEDQLEMMEGGRAQSYESLDACPLRKAIEDCFNNITTMLGGRTQRGSKINTTRSKAIISLPNQVKRAHLYQKKLIVNQDMLVCGMLPHRPPYPRGWKG